MINTVAGIPCVIKVLSRVVQKPDSRADNPDDYYGYTEVEFEVCDRRGRPAPWLRRKLTPIESERIENEILEELA